MFTCRRWVFAEKDKCAIKSLFNAVCSLLENMGSSGWDMTILSHELNKLFVQHSSYCQTIT